MSWILSETFSVFRCFSQRSVTRLCHRILISSAKTLVLNFIEIALLWEDIYRKQNREVWQACSVRSVYIWRPWNTKNSVCTTALRETHTIAVLRHSEDTKFEWHHAQNLSRYISVWRSSKLSLSDLPSFGKRYCTQCSLRPWCHGPPHNLMWIPRTLPLSSSLYRLPLPKITS
jgi:hypothetical protein